MPALKALNCITRQNPTNKSGTWTWYVVSLCPWMRGEKEHSLLSEVGSVLKQQQNQLSQNI